MPKTKLLILQSLKYHSKMPPDRGATGATVERLQCLTDLIEAEMPVDAS